MLAVITGAVAALLLISGLAVGWVWVSNPERKDLEPILVLIGLILPLLVSLVVYLARYRETSPDGQEKGQDSNPVKLEHRHLLEQARLLTAYLDKLDDETGWNQRGFLDPEAQVDEQVAELGRGGRIRRVAALLKVLHKGRKHNLFLLLGDPGSGKSVALRQCARRWLETEIYRTNTVPLYLNLREWPREPSWTDACPPTEEEVDASLRTFTRVILEKKVRSYFLADHFTTLHSNACFFLLLDSFDEIPAVLDVRERGPLIDALSRGLHFFVTGGNAARDSKCAYAGRGVLASRLYRAPTDGFQESCRLEVRPFSDGVLRDLLHSHGISLPIADRFLTEHAELAAAARNPFTAQLFASHIRARVQEGAVDPIPHSRAESYEYFLGRQLQRAADALAHTQHAVSSEELRIGLDLLAARLFASTDGFDLPVAVIANIWPDQAAREARLAALTDVHLIRWEKNSLSIGFAHRRYAEYFAACGLSDDQARTHLNHLSSVNGLWRDVLVVYCERATNESLSAVVTYAWQMARPLVLEDTADEVARARGQNALRFLLEAVRGRTKSMEVHQDVIAAYVDRVVRDLNNDLLRARETAEFAGLLAGSALETAMLAVLDRGNWWVLEAALHSCRYQQTPGRKVLSAFCRSIDETPPLRLFDPHGFVTSLGFSPGLREVWLYAQSVRWSIGSSIGCMIIAPLANWLTACFAAVHVFQTTVSDHLKPSHDNVSKWWFPLGLRFEREFQTHCIMVLFSRLVLLVVVGVQIAAYLSPSFSKEVPKAVPTTVEFIVLLVCGALSLPIPEFFGFRNLFYSFRRWLFLSVFICAVVAILYFALDSVAKTAGITMPSFSAAILFVSFSFALAMAIGIPLGLVLYGWRWFCDYQYFASEMAFPERTTTRVVIKEIFMTMKTSYWRLRFVERLERKAIIATGPWPGGSGPGTRNRAADQRLSALDQRWREEEGRREDPEARS
jgi:hypothetical protein